jgi:hypothetical protein
MDDAPFTARSAEVRRRLEPVIAEVCARRGRPVTIQEPAAPFAPWVVVADGSGRNVVTISAHAQDVDFLLGPEAELRTIERPLETADLIARVTEILEAAFDDHGPAA